MKKILIIDDSEIIRTIVETVLSIKDYEVLQAGDGEEGLSILAEQKVNLILCDVSMPNMDGIAFIKELKSRSDLKSTPICMLTAEYPSSRRQEAKQLGVTEWVAKPFDSGKLLEIISFMTR